MSNNPILFNAAFAGSIDGMQSGRQISAPNASVQPSYELAVAVDALIPTNESLNQQDANLLQSIVDAAVRNRFVSLQPSFDALAMDIVDLWTMARLLLIVPSGPATWATQASWAIDATNGDDSAAGTPAAPLKTMEELSARLSDLGISVAQTVQCIGDVVDSPLTLNGTRFIGVGSLTILGTVVDGGTTATITNVTVLQTGTTFQLTTDFAGWLAADVGTRIALSTGAVHFIQEVTAANIIIVGPGSTGVTPVNGLTLTQQTASKVLPPNVNITSPVLASSLVFQDVEIQAGPQYINGVVAFFSRCLIISAASQVWLQDRNLTLGGCCLVLGGAFTINGSGQFTFSSVTVVGTGSQTVTVQCSRAQWATVSWAGAGVAVQRGGLLILSGTHHFRNCTATQCILLQQGARAVQFNVTVNGSVGNTGLGVRLLPGNNAYTYLVVKPAVTGAVGDVKIGLTTRTYAQVPYTDLRLDAIPPVGTLLIGSPACMTLEA